MAERAFERLHELDVRDGLERGRGLRCGQRLQFGAGDEIGVHMGQELPVIHVVVLLLFFLDLGLR